MFVCPHCQSENPLQNRFCQKCGKALRELQAIVLPIDGPSECSSQETAPVNSIDAASPSATAVATVTTLLTPQNRLKGQERYQLRQPTDADKPLSGAVTILSILDCEPAADSPLVEFLENAPDDLDQAAIDQMIPPLAFPYWELQESLYPVVPELQAAWQTEDYAITVIEDRTTWRTLMDLVSAGLVEPLELVHWFYEIIALWIILSPFAAETSILEPDNLRVDDDQIVCLQRLIFNPDDTPPTLPTLGQLWQTWLAQLALPQSERLDDLVTDLVAGVLDDPTIVQNRLVEIADHLSDPAAVPPPAADEAAPPPVEPAEDSLAAPEVLLAAAIAPASEATTIADSPLLGVEDLLLVPELEADPNDSLTAEVTSDDSNLGDLPTMALPMRLYRLDEAGRTHVGRQRAHNEDSFFAHTEIQRVNNPAGTQITARGLYILCDGMGGHSGGEVASQIAVTSLKEYFDEYWQGDLPDEDVIRTGILQANQAIFDQNESEERAGNARMGTTLVMVLVHNSQVAVAHVGDSRLYGLTRQGLSQLTVDHEVGQREINRGVEPAIAYARPDAYQLTQALGPRSNQEIAPTITSLTVSQDTLLVLCSDGLSDNELLESHVESHLTPLMRTKVNLEDGVADLIDLANDHNGHDNITAIVVRMKLRPHLNAANETD
ncbi:serine/threonine phosphatase [Halomicronema sp. CCY15110]|uniref:serine/threonine phosphatase n=1 Tax=Halomicronema sp. CCY15110 TaxID=2767773 RepID=UPI00194F8762|nr:serine/threonine phosphatase [Halomicronema sp. CCY15110]